MSGKVVNEFSLKAKTFKLTKLPISGGNCWIRLLYKYNSRTCVNYNNQTNPSLNFFLNKTSSYLFNGIW